MKVWRVTVALLVGGCVQPSSVELETGAAATESIATTSSSMESDPSSMLSMTSTTAMDESTSLDTSSGPMSGGITVDPDVGVSIECSVWDQDCPRGEKCMPWADDGGNSWNATTCMPVDPDPAQPGEACHAEQSAVSGIDDCAVASMCFYVDEATLEGVCIAFCGGSENNPECGASTTCTIMNEGTITLCLATCDPLLQDCAEARACYGVDADFVCLPDRSGELGAFGDPCDSNMACDPGNFCANPDAIYACDAAACCSSYCDLEASDADMTCLGYPDGQVCLPAFEKGQAPLEHADVGVCAIPS